MKKRSPSAKWYTAGIGGVGLASLFSDSSHEMVTSLLPTFLTSTLHASAGALGLIEGLSDALTGVMKLAGGPLANDPKRRGRLAAGGYVGTALATAAIGLTATVWQAGVLRAIAWMSRGLRSPARDAMLASLAREEHYGKAYGLERAGDNLGAVVGPLLASLLVGLVGVRGAMLVSVLPGLLAAAAITVAAREATRLAGQAKERVRFDLRALREAGLLRQLLPIAFFEFGNIATTLLILRATQLLATDGRSLTAATVLAIIIYAAHNAFGALVAYVGGRWIDRVGPRIVFGCGALLYVFAYAAFAASFRSWLWLLLAFIAAGAAIGLAETAESTLVARVVPDALRGSGFGFLGGVQALGDFVSTAVVGLLYAAVSPSVGFLYAAAWMVLSLIALGVSRRRRMAG
ncbi:MFS transporter [Amnibacterium sp.]|uniref:MFS transporter n=1 Tax=Amnibacterium sp. TaxID=1872496 RepID=UPI003F7BCF29